MRRSNRNMLMAAGVFVLAGMLAAGGGLRNLTLDGGLVGWLGLGFLGMGAFAFVSGRVYGRTWEKYWGGWVSRSENPGYYWSYTAMYVLGGLLLLGCGSFT